MYLDKSLQEYLDDLSSAKPTPGGGSAAALSGAMGAALVSMVALLTLGKPKYADVQEEVEALRERAANLRQRFQQWMQDDIEAYGNLSSCFKMPRGSDKEKAERARAVQQALRVAALIPLAMAEGAAELIAYCERMAEIGNVNVISDIAAAAMMATGAGAGAAWMVRVNLHSMKEEELISRLSQRLQESLEALEAGRQRVISIIGARS